MGVIRRLGLRVGYFSLNWQKHISQGVKLRSCHTTFKRHRRDFNLNEREAVCLAYLAMALKELDDIRYLLQFFFLRPVGNAMRCYCEAVGMALLVNAPSLKVFEQLRKNIKNSEGGIAIQRLSDKNIRERLAIDEDSLLSLLKIAEFYNQYSHSSLVNIVYQTKYKRTQGYTVFNKEQIPDYQKLYIVFDSLMDHYLSAIDACADMATENRKTSQE
jgi:hypothetical protein